MINEIFRDENIDLSFIQNKRIGIVGFGNQGRAQALNLIDSGMDVTVGVRDSSKSIDFLKMNNIPYQEIEKLILNVDIVVLLLPDTQMKSVYYDSIHNSLSVGQTLIFAHGYNIHYNIIQPPDFVNIGMVAPSGGGQLLRDRYKDNSGIPSLLAVNQDYSGDTLEIIKSYGKAIGTTRICSFLSTFKEETETDLFGEQALLAGSIPLSIEKSLKVLLDHGYSPITAWFVCYYETKMIIALFHEKGIDFLYKAISDTARYGGLKSGKFLIDDTYEEKLNIILDDIKSGKFKKELEEKVDSLSFKTEIDQRFQKKIADIQNILFNKNNN